MKTSIEVLRDEYPGDAAWDRFVAAYTNDWEKVPNKEGYVSMTGSKDVSVVLGATMGANAFVWFHEPCRALGNRTPVEVLQNEFLGIQIVRTLLMRMP